MKRQNIFLSIGFVSLALFLCVACAVSFGWLLPLDRVALTAINSYASPHFDSFFLTITHLGGVVFVTLFTLGIIGLALVKKRYTFALFVSIVMAGMIVCNLLLKSLFERSRPELWDLLVNETSYSFPSGHATATMALAIVVCAFFWNTRWRWLAFCLGAAYVVCVSFSRLYLGVHYPSDIIGGWLLSILIASFTAFFIIRFAHSKKVRTEP